MSDQTASTATTPNKDSDDAKRTIKKMDSNKMVKPPSHAAYGNVLEQLYCHVAGMGCVTSMESKQIINRARWRIPTYNRFDVRRQAQDDCPTSNQADSEGESSKVGTFHSVTDGVVNGD